MCAASPQRNKNQGRRVSMALDKEALQSLRLEHGADPRRYEDSPLRRHRRWIIAGAVALVLALIGLKVMNAPLEVRTALVEAPAGASDGAVLNASGYVVARRLATVSSKVTGRIAEVLFEEGAAVAEGEVLARLDPATARAEHAVAASGVEAARRNLREIEVRLDDARRTLARNTSLVERKLVAQSVLDGSEAEVAALEARLAAARAEADVARSRLALSAQALEDLAIRARRMRSRARPSRRCRPAAATRAPASPPSSTWTRARSRWTSTRRTSTACATDSASRRCSMRTRTGRSPGT